MAQQIFERIEKKLMLTELQYRALKPVLEEHLVPDDYSEYTISNIYFDTEDFRLIRTSLEKPSYKEKLRLRAYGMPGEDSRVFIELKKKYRGIVYKRRVEMCLKDARNYLYYDQYPEQDSQILREIEYARGFYGLVPKVMIAYDRTAFHGKEDADLRVTFDRNIRGREKRLELSEGNQGLMLNDMDQILMEVKIPGAMPLWMAQTFSQLQIRMTSYSKYGAYYQKFCAEQVGRRAAAAAAGNISGAEKAFQLVVNQ